MCTVFLVILLVCRTWWLCLCFSHLLTYAGAWFALRCSFMDVLAFLLVQRIPPHIFCSASLRVMNSFYLFYFGIFFITTSIMTESFVGYSKLGWLLFSFWAWKSKFLLRNRLLFWWALPTPHFIYDLVFLPYRFGCIFCSLYLLF